MTALRSFIGFLLASSACACTTPEETVAASEGASLVEARSMRAGEAAKVSACDAKGACRELAVGENIGARKVVTSEGTLANLEVGPSIRVAISPGSTVAGLGSTQITVERGTATFEALAGEALFTTPIVVAGAEVRRHSDRDLKVVVSSDGEDGTVSVHRGAVTVGEGDRMRRLTKGQSADIETEGDTIERATANPEAIPDVPFESIVPSAVRGLGRMTARVPGRTDVTGGVHLAKHEVKVVIRHGIATTTVEEVFANDTSQVLEGRFVFPVPPSATVSRLALWVGDELVEGEMVERKRAADIFRGIVDDTVRPRDPALLEWSRGSELSLKIFPMPAKGERRVLLTYEEPVSSLGGHGRYVYPLSAGEDRATKIDRFSVSVKIDGDGVFDLATPYQAASITNERGASQVSWSADDASPDRDFVITWQEPKSDGALAISAPTSRIFAVRALLNPSLDLTIDLPVPTSRVVVLDASQSQSTSTFAAQASLAGALVRSLEGNERFAVLACDSACVSFPEDGLASASPEMTAALGAWLGRIEPGGSSDLAGALTAGLERLPRVDAAQLVWLGDGSPSSGELTVDAIVARARRVAPPTIDLRLIGVGRTVDELVLRGIADGLGATYRRLDPGSATTRQNDELVLELSQPVVRDLTAELPSGATLASEVPSTARLGEELVLAGQGDLRQGSEVRLRGRIGNEHFEHVVEVSLAPLGSDIAERTFARARIDMLTRRGDSESEAEIVSLSQRFSVMSRHTSLLVLENDAMFRAFGIERTNGKKLEAATPKPTSTKPSPSDPLTGALPFSPWPNDPNQIDLGSPWGNGDAFGHGGLGLSGTGAGGSGRGEAIGLGEIGTIGKGSGTGFGIGDGRLGGMHRSSPPRVRMGATSTSGRLPPEVIQRIVRQNFGRFRLCYENGLRRNPGLEGRVAVRFVIGVDGSVSNVADGGATLPDADVVACVVRSFTNLSFPAPEAGVVTVSYPLMFSPGSEPTPEARSFVDAPRAQHQSSDDAWMTAGEPQAEELRFRLAADDTKRSAHVALVRGLLARGRFDEALTRARRLVEIDPDLPLGLDLLAQASLATGDRSGALRALDGMTELSPRSTSAHRRAARGHEASGDERRACAHWRALASLSPEDPEGEGEAFRCRARVLGEADTVREALRDRVAHRKDLEPLARQLEAGGLPAYASKPTWGNVVPKVICEGSGCPDAFTLDRMGNVVSPIIPDEQGHSWARLQTGSVRTLLVGGEPGKSVRVSVVAEGISFTSTLTTGERRSVALSRPL